MHGGHHEYRHGGDRAFAWSAGINLGFVLLQAGFGLAANSLALLSDAAHNLSDVAALLLAWWASRLGRRRPDERRTFGLGRASILAALANGAALFVVVGALALEAGRRLLNPEPFAEGMVALVAAAGILVNGGTALLFRHGAAHDLNQRGAWLHLMGDAAVSAGVVAAALGAWATGWIWLDPLCSLAVGTVIAWASWGLLRDALHLSLDGVPANLDTREVRAALAAIPGVSEVHDLHLWALSTTETALSAHLVQGAEANPGALLRAAQAEAQRFGIGHATFQLEDAAFAEACRLRSDEVA
jgi:cobalt-zinc-cadmium efflux system protein